MIGLSGLRIPGFYKVILICNLNPTTHYIIIMNDSLSRKYLLMLRDKIHIDTVYCESELPIPKIINSESCCL